MILLCFGFGIQVTGIGDLEMVYRILPGVVFGVCGCLSKAAER